MKGLYYDKLLEAYSKQMRWYHLHMLNYASEMAMLKRQLKEAKDKIKDLEYETLRNNKI